MPGQLTLAEWRKARGLSQRDAAARLTAVLGRTVTQQNIQQWEAGVMPGADIGEAIRKLTGGKVTGSSFGRVVTDGAVAEKQKPCPSV